VSIWLDTIPRPLPGGIGRGAQAALTEELVNAGEFLCKTCDNAVDCCPSGGIFVIPRQAGLLYLECVLCTFWDCKLELNFVPVYRAIVRPVAG
jgi:hypothetical protein